MLNLMDVSAVTGPQKFGSRKISRCFRFQRAYSGFWLLVLLMLAFGTTSTNTPAADDIQNTASARAVAKQAVQAYQEEDFEKAIELFQKAERLHHATTHLLYMARAHAKLGRPVEAFELYNSIIREDLNEKGPEAFVQAQESAREEVTDVEDAIAHVIIEVEGPGAEDASIFAGERQIPSALIGLPAPVNPGQQSFRAESAGSRSETITKEMTSGKKVTVKLTLVVTAPTPAAEEQGAGMEREGGRSKLPAYVALGVGGVGITLGIIFTAQHFSKKKSANDMFAERGCDTACGAQDQLEIEEIDKQAATFGTMAILGYGVGVAGLATGVALLLLSPKESERARREHVHPYFGWGEIGLAGRF